MLFHLCIQGLSTVQIARDAGGNAEKRAIGFQLLLKVQRNEHHPKAKITVFPLKFGAPVSPISVYVFEDLSIFLSGALQVMEKE